MKKVNFYDEEKISTDVLLENEILKRDVGANEENESVEDDIKSLNTLIFKNKKRLESKTSFWLCAIVGIICGVLCGLALYNNNKDIYRPYSMDNYDFLVYILPIIVGILIAAVITFILYILFKYKLESSIADCQAEIMYLESNNIKHDVQEDIFNNSIKMSYKYLDQYYLQTKDQARKGFYITAGIAIIGALLIIIGIFAMFMGKVSPAYVSAGAGVLIEFISSIFFYLYNKTVRSMSQYHNKLVLSHNISIALKVAETLPDSDKTASKNLIIKELLQNVNHYLVSEENNVSKP